MFRLQSSSTDSKGGEEYFNSCHIQPPKAIDSNNFLIDASNIVTY